MSQPNEETVAELRLTFAKGIGPILRRALVERFGSAAQIFAAGPSDWRDVPGVGAKLVQSLSLVAQQDIASEWSYCQTHGIEVLTQSHPLYPAALREIPDPPGVLFMHGSLMPSDALAIAIVGSRHATHYGLTQAERLAGSLARAGLTIISGLARGIDAAAHRGALQAGGRTIAVLGSGVANIYPPEHVELAGEVVARGALLSESPPRFPPISGAFPQRNRIVTGMSLGVIVVEAAKSSGALISARHAMEQGRDVFAVPGRVDSRASQGCHQLIRDGAKLVESADDVLEELGPLLKPTATPDGRDIRHPAELQLNDIERQILDAIQTQATSIDSVIAATSLPAQQVLSTISVLEMRRLIRRVSGMAVLRP
jgi:DNA processing protein